MIPYSEYIENDMLCPDLKEIKKKKLCDNIISFDIETCNYFVKDHVVYSINDIIEKYKADVAAIEAFFDSATAGATPYIWQFCIDGVAIYGREFKEVKKVLTYISKKTRGHEVHIFIHNAAFEYQYLQELLKIKKRFFTEARKPLYFQYKNLYFRCSYRLTNLSLAKWGKNLHCDKKVGQLDYYGLYSPRTKLSPEQLEYCEYDVLIMNKGLHQYRDQYKHVAYIPLTQTGIPRRDLKALNQKEKGYLNKVAMMQPRTPEEWKVQHFTYCGGLTLCNPKNVGKVLYNVGGIDKKSAYPFTFLMKFPSTSFEQVTAPPVWDDGNHHICLVEFINLRAKYDITPLSSTKRILIEGGVFAHDSETDFQKIGIARNNGKIIKAKRYATYITEIDYKLIKMYYDCDKEIIHDHYIALSDYMPRHVIMYMLECYAKKTLLTGVDEVMRARAKEILNALYGLAATALVHDDIIEDNDFNYIKTRLNDEQIQQELITLHQKKYKNVLPYCYGIYVTAYQRYFLMEMAHKFLKNGRLDKLCYFDTDSIKALFDENDYKIIEEENERIIQWTKERCALQDIPYEMTCPKNTKGNREYLGTWEQDIDSPNKKYYQIKFIRAKCYAYKLTPEDHVHHTIAGVPKAASNVLHEVDDLKDGLTFDIFNSRKSLLTYCDGNNPLVTMPDGYKVKNTCSVNIRPTSYTLKLDGEYKSLIKKYLSEKYH